MTTTWFSHPPLQRSRIDENPATLLPAPARNSQTADARTKSALDRPPRLLLGLLTLTVLAPVFPLPAWTAENWRPVDPADLKLKDNPASPGSDAMILYRQEFVDDPGFYRTEYYRIKIFTRSGEQYADVEIPFLKGWEKLKDVRGRTIRPDGTIIDFDGKLLEKVVVKAQGIKVYEKTFSLPDVEPGCIIEYQYRVEQDPFFFKAGASWTVQQDLFTRLADFEIRPFGAALYWRPFHLPSNVVPKKEKSNTYVLELHDIPAFVKEPHMVPAEMLESRLDFFYGSGEKETAEQFWKRIAQNWNKGMENFIRKKDALQKVVAQIIQPGDPPETKLRKIYARVEQVRNLDFEPFQTQQEEKREKLKENENVEDVLKHGYATGLDINYLFVGLTRAAGFDATDVAVAPRNRYFFDPGLRDTHQLAENLVEVPVDSTELYLDPGALYYPFGLLPWYETSVRGLRLEKQFSGFITIPPPRSVDAQILRRGNLRLSADGSLSGTLEVDLIGQEAGVWRMVDANNNETGRQKDLKEEIKGWLPSNAAFEITKLSDWDDNSKPIHITGSIHIPGLGMVAGQRILIPLTPFRGELEQAFASTRRVNDVYLHFPYQVSDDLTIELAQGFRLESLPKAPQIARGVILYNIGAKQDGSQLHLTRQLDLDAFFYPVKVYSQLRAVFQTVKTGDEDQIVLETSSASAQRN